MLNELDVLKDVAARLERAGVQYMLTGSLAMNYYAQPRMTRDIDLVVALERKDAGIAAAMFGADYYVSEEAVKEAVARNSMFNIIHLASVVKVDFVVRKRSPFRIQEFERRRRVGMKDFEVWIASKEDLILSKLDWARDSRSDTQLRDVKNLAATGCDPKYIETWAAQLGLSELWRECSGG